MFVHSSNEESIMKTLLTLGSITVALAAALTGCEKKQVLSAAITPDVIPNISISRVGRSSVADYYEATGTVNAKTTTQISTNVLGRINSIPVKEGDTVNKGQILVEIDDREGQVQLQKAQAGLSEAQASLTELDSSTSAANAAVKTAEANKRLGDVTFARYKELYTRRSVSGQEYDEALSRAKAATSELERAKENFQTMISKKAQIHARISQAKADIANAKVYVSYSRIVSPVSGVVVKKFVESGATASPGVPLLSIEDSSQYRLEAAVAESRSKPVRIGERVNVRIDALGAVEIIGIVAEILPTSDAASRSYTVKIGLPANPLLRSGLYGLARFPLSQREAITIPETAIVQRGQLTGVYIIGPDGTVRFRIVTTGKASEGMVEVLSGVHEWDELASSDTQKLSDGAKVR
jgi:multidrug efflux pump subunit AcrA (membrane-fusion protein)